MAVINLSAESERPAKTPRASGKHVTQPDAANENDGPCIRTCA